MTCLALVVRISSVKVGNVWVSGRLRLVSVHGDTVEL
jgi:hypothetical protein